MHDVFKFLGMAVELKGEERGNKCATLFSEVVIKLLS